MPSNRRRTRQPQTETPAQTDPTVTPEPNPETGPVEGNELEGGAGQEEQTAEGQNTGESTEEGQGAGEDQSAAEDHTLSTAEQTATEAPASTGESQSALPMTVQLRGGVPAEDIVATTDVTLGGICTIRNVKIKQDDYGVKVVMPRTKMPDTGRFKDACYFHTPELREQFDAAVKDAYQQTLQPENTQAPEQGGMGGMVM